MLANKQKSEKFYVTTPIYYVNDRPHLGHAYTTVAADVLVRFHKLQGEKVFFLTGTDEHGVKIEKAAQKANKTPRQLCDENSQIFKKTWQDLNISFDNFIRTTDPEHIKAVQKALQILYDKGLIYKGVYEGLYCSGCEQYKTKSDLIDGKCPDHQIEPEAIKEESYLFKLSQFQNVLEKKIGDGELEIEPAERKNEVLGFLKQGLQDISISRQKVKWGISLPFDKEHTTYVWVDAFLNYLTGIGWEGEPKNLPQFWPPDLQLMSKDILRVHATIWTSLLSGLEILLPKKIFTHGYFTINGQKMSKSLGNVILPEDLIEKFSIDGTRYLLISLSPFGRDADISWEKLTEKYNADLANGIGNLASRVLTMVEKKFDGLVPSASASLKPPELLNSTLEKFIEHFNQVRLSEAVGEIFRLSRYIDQSIDKLRIYNKPPKEAASDLYAFLEVLRIIALMLSPFMPETAAKIFEQLGLDFEKEKQKKFKEVVKWGSLKPGSKIKKGKSLFPRI